MFDDPRFAAARPARRRATSRRGTRCAIADQRDAARRLDGGRPRRRAAACCSASQHSLRSDAARADAARPPRQFERAFRRIRARYPDVRDWIAWNEANHPFSLTANRPRRAAQYFDAVAWNCAGCRIVAADVLDVERDVGVGAALPAPRRAPRRGSGACTTTSTPTASRSSGTRALLRHHHAGRSGSPRPAALVLRREYAGTTRDAASSATRQRHAARATAPRAPARLPEPAHPARLPLPLARAASPVTNWDSAFVGPHGRRRAPPTGRSGAACSRRRVRCRRSGRGEERRAAPRRGARRPGTRAARG